MNKTNNTNEKYIVNILWTGGWDSTFRMLQLSSKDIIIQPHYLVDNSRKSRNFELNTIRSITEEIRNLPTTRCIICDIKLVNVYDIDADPEITNAYKNIAQKHRLGIQYEWLARYSKKVNHLEIGDENGSSPDSILLKAINSNGAIKKVVDENAGTYYIVDEQVSSDDIRKVFGNYHYPILFYTKLLMKKEAEKNGFIEILNKTWFCHTPINGQPCGTCIACEMTIKKGLDYRLSKAALRRNRRKKLLMPVRNTILFKSISKFKRQIKNAILHQRMKKNAGYRILSRAGRI